MKKTILVLLLAAALLMAACAKTEKGEAPAPNALFTEVRPADEALRLAKEGGEAVVLEGLVCTAGEELMTAFYDSVSAGKPAAVLTAFYYTLDPDRVAPELYEEEKDRYPQLFFYWTAYDGDRFTVTARQSTEETPEQPRTFAHLLHLRGEYPSQLALDGYDNYVLTDDPDVTWEQIEASMVSSQSGAMIPHCAIFQTAF